MTTYTKTARYSMLAAATLMLFTAAPAFAAKKNNTKTQRSSIVQQIESSTGIGQSATAKADTNPNSNSGSNSSGSNDNSSTPTATTTPAPATTTSSDPSTSTPATSTTTDTSATTTPAPATATDTNVPTTAPSEPVQTPPQIIIPVSPVTPAPAVTVATDTATTTPSPAPAPSKLTSISSTLGAIEAAIASAKSDIFSPTPVKPVATATSTATSTGAIATTGIASLFQGSAGAGNVYASNKFDESDTYKLLALSLALAAAGLFLTNTKVFSRTYKDLTDAIITTTPRQTSRSRA